MRVGSTLKIGGPRNHFELDETAPHTVLVAGGIGVTPIVCMARRLAEQGKAFSMLYCARSRADALAWCVRLVGRHTEDWLTELRDALGAVERVRATGPDTNTGADS